MLVQEKTTRASRYSPCGHRRAYKFPLVLSPILVPRFPLLVHVKSPGL